MGATAHYHLLLSRFEQHVLVDPTSSIDMLAGPALTMIRRMMIR